MEDNFSTDSVGVGAGVGALEGVEVGVGETGASQVVIQAKLPWLNCSSPPAGQPGS